MRRGVLDDIAQIHERIDLQVLTGLHERTQDGRAVRRCFAARKQIILPAQDRPRVILPMSDFVRACTTSGTRWVGTT